MLDSKQYWVDRYANGNDSGSGSDGVLGDYKASFINSLIHMLSLKSIVDHGCGDGKLLNLLDLEGVEYRGYDVSIDAISKIEGFHVSTYDDYIPRRFDLALSMDVLFHLIEDEVFNSYMSMLFNDGEFVLIYGYDSEDDPMLKHGRRSLPHMKYRSFSKWISENTSHYLSGIFDNPYTYDHNTRTGSICSFYLYHNVV